MPLIAPLRGGDDPNPFVAYDSALVWSQMAADLGLTLADRVALIRDVDTRIQAVDGTGFRRTPFNRADTLSDALGFTGGGGIWLKDETANVSGSHKARHLMTILLVLLAEERAGIRSELDRAPLAIASCGNAALAAATLAAAVNWPLAVFVPPWGNPAVLDRLRALGAQVTLCPRLDDDPPGDPCVHRFHEAVRQGAVPFAVQGPENALCLDGGRTIGWEMAESGIEVTRVYVQVGGGALATGIGQGFADAGQHPTMHAVQAAGCAPLERAWRAAQSFGIEHAGAHWSECMWPWETEPFSAATGILDDETYDWLGVVNEMWASGGSPLVVSEDAIEEANALIVRYTSIPADHTGTAALAGLLVNRAEVDNAERVAVPMTGRRRT